MKVVQWSRMFSVKNVRDFHANMLMQTPQWLLELSVHAWFCPGNTMSRPLADFTAMGPKVNTAMGPHKVPSSPAVASKPTWNVFLRRLWLDHEALQSNVDSLADFTHYQVVKRGGDEWKKKVFLGSVSSRGPLKLGATCSRLIWPSWLTSLAGTWG